MDPWRNWRVWLVFAFFLACGAVTVFVLYRTGRDTGYP